MHRKGTIKTDGIFPYSISRREFYRLKKEVQESTHERLNLIASKEFLMQHMDRIDELRTINKEMWTNYHLEKNPFKKVQILEKIEENQVYLSSYYDSTRYVLEQYIKQQQNQNGTQKSNSISLL
jgi:hypothetical protein